MAAGIGSETDASRADDALVAVARAATALLIAVNASDLEAVLGVWCDDGVMMPPHHPSIHGLAQIRRYFERLFRQSRFEFSFTSSRIEIAGDVAFERVEYAASAWPAEGGSEVRDVGKGLHVYRRQANGAWKLAMDIWNSDNPNASAT
jgi:uncharacterized protein (TIGR02246 family)